MGISGRVTGSSARRYQAMNIWVSVLNTRSYHFSASFSRILSSSVWVIAYWRLDSYSSYVSMSVLKVVTIFDLKIQLTFTLWVLRWFHRTWYLWLKRRTPFRGRFQQVTTNSLSLLKQAVPKLIQSPNASKTFIKFTKFRCRSAKYLGLITKRNWVSNHSHNIIYSRVHGLHSYGNFYTELFCLKSCST